MNNWIGWVGGAAILGFSACATSEMPDAPEGVEIASVDVVIRLRRKN